MTRSVAPALGVALAVALLAGAAGPALAHGTELTGTVTAAGGAPVEGAVVLAQPAEATHLEDALAAEDPAAALADLAADPPFSVRVDRTNASGGYTVHLSSVGRWDVVAVSGDAVSALQTDTYTRVRETRDLTVGGVGAGGSNGTDAPAGTPTPDRVVSVDLDDGGPAADERGLLPVGVGVFVVGVAVAAFAAGRTGVPYLEG